MANKGVNTNNLEDSDLRYGTASQASQDQSPPEHVGTTFPQNTWI
jgi:hypothetical protein